MPNYVCITHEWVQFMEASGKIIARCCNCGLKRK